MCQHANLQPAWHLPKHPKTLEVNRYYSMCLDSCTKMRKWKSFNINRKSNQILGQKFSNFQLNRRNGIENSKKKTMNAMHAYPFPWLFFYVPMMDPFATLHVHGELVIALHTWGLLQNPKWQGAASLGSLIGPAAAGAASGLFLVPLLVLFLALFFDFVFVCFNFWKLQKYFWLM